MFDGMKDFLVHWATLTGALWLAAHLFSNVRFDSRGALIAAALLLGLANTFVRPLVILLTLPFTLITFGLFLLVINGLMVLLVARLVRGFQITGLWTAILVSIFISLFSFAVNWFLTSQGATFPFSIGPMGPLDTTDPSGFGTWI
ncbi:MAG: phage holin family protein [Sterolibacterium sp.]|nr:phage holin family protein [Sterolibacterium sp.]